MQHYILEMAQHNVQETEQHYILKEVHKVVVYQFMINWIYRSYCATCTGHVVPLKTDVISRPNLHINL